MSTTYKLVFSYGKANKTKGTTTTGSFTIDNADPSISLSKVTAFTRQWDTMASDGDGTVGDKIEAYVTKVVLRKTEETEIWPGV